MIAVTGSAIWSSLGNGFEPVMSAIHANQTGRQALRRVAVGTDEIRTQVGMCSRELAFKGAGANEHWRFAVGKAIELARGATLESGLPNLNHYRPERMGVFVGTTFGSNGEYLYLLEKAHAQSAPSHELLTWSASEAAQRIAMELGVTGPALTFSTACSSGLNAIGQAANWLSSGVIDCAIVGGIDIVSDVTILGFNSLGALSVGGCSPFDEHRDGLSLGDGGAFLVLERSDAVSRRGQKPKGYVTGYGCFGEGFHPTAPDPDGTGAERVMRTALEQDGHPEDLDWVSAHGTGTPANDIAELRAIERVMSKQNGEQPLTVFSLKATLGHTLGAAGALEVACTLELMKLGLAPGMPAMKNPIGHRDAIQLTHSSAFVDPKPRLALCNSFGFGGSIAAVTLRTIPL